jgi:hypothetical protein
VSNWVPPLKKIIKSLASLKFAVVIIIALAILLTVGTIVETKYNADVAKKWVYDTYWMYAVLGALSVTLMAVMADRWPWKRRHLSFLLAHVGILLLLLGAHITSKFGIDGSMRVEVGKSNRMVSLPITELTLWSSFTGDQYAKLYDQPVDFFLNRPEKNPFSIPTEVGELKISAYRPFVLASKKWRISEDQKMGAALRFQLQNERANVIDWVSQKKKNEIGRFNLGPASVFLGPIPVKIEPGQNAIYFTQKEASSELSYALFSKQGEKIQSGTVSEGQVVKTPWMALEARILRFLPAAEEFWEFKDLERPTPISTSAIEVEFQNKKHWLQQNDVLKLFTENSVYILTYGQKRLDLGFDLQLMEFEVGRYQGTQRAASYQSRVDVPGVGQKVISMNEPLNYNGYKIFQASFEEGQGPAPTASIFSINRDPGVELKYLGSLILSLGVIFLFVDRRKGARNMGPRETKEFL